MSAPPAHPAVTGLPVEIGQIDKALGKLWEESGDSKSRASLINLAIYTEDPDSVEGTTSLIAQVASEHACRAILIYANHSAAEPSARAWINAHCHTPGKGGRQICSEQITFQLDGELSDALPNIVFSHLDSDLPLCLWWQSEFRRPLDPKLWAWVDRLIYDSRNWSDAGEQLTTVREISHLAGVRTVLCDLNWSRILNARFALASLFDHTCAIEKIRSISRVEIAHGPGDRNAACLLLGWLAAQLGWRLESVLSKYTFQTSDTRTVEFEFREVEGPSISECRFDAGGSVIRLTREAGSEFFHGSVDQTTRLLPAGRDGLRELLLMELSRGGVHPLYHKALNAIEPLLGG